MDSKQTNGHSVPLRRISLSYNNAESESSALRLVYAIEPKWREEEGEIEVTRFTDGITNNVSLKEGLSVGNCANSPHP
jgi:ethanolamine kinase